VCGDELFRAALSVPIVGVVQLAKSAAGAYGEGRLGDDDDERAANGDRDVGTAKCWPKTEVGVVVWVGLSWR
jgi:hypothetical protein